MKSHCPSTANKSNHTRAQKEQIDTELEAEHKQSVIVCDVMEESGGSQADRPKPFRDTIQRE